MGVRTALIFSTILLWVSSAWGQGRISEVIFEATDSSSTFLLIHDGEIKSDQVEKLADADPSVLMVRFNGLKAKRQWVKMTDKVIKRALLHPSKEKTNAVVLRIRFKTKRVNNDLLETVSVVLEDAGIRVDIPNDTEQKPKPRVSADETQALNKAELDKQLNAMKSDPSAVGEEPSVKMNSSPAQPVERMPERSDSTEASPAAPPAMLAKVNEEASPVAPTAAGPNPLPIQPEDPKAKTEAPAPETADTKPEEETTDPATIKAPVEPGLVFMPGVRTRDVVAGFTDMTLRLEKGLKSKPGIRRIAVFPFLALDPRAAKSELAPISRALLTDRLLRRSGIISANRDRLEETLTALPKDKLGRFAIDEARAVGEVIGADTLVIGTLSTTGNGFLVDARAVDVTSGTRLVDASQEFEDVSLQSYANLIRRETTIAGGIWRSAVMPGWGQFYQGEYGRGVTYGAIFATAFISGVIAGVLGNIYADEYTSSDKADAVQYRESANRAYGQANVFLAISGLMWASSIADAWITGKNETTIDPRRYEEALEFSK